MAMILPDDVLGVIRDFSRPYRTRPDWQTCKRMEASRIQQYYDFGRFLFTLAWYAVTDENGHRVFYNQLDIAQHLRETNMINRILRFEETMPFEMNIMDILYVWFHHNWAAGIALLPA